MEIEIRTGDFIDNWAATSGGALYEVIYPLKIDDVVNRWVSRDFQTVAEWHLSGQVAQLIPNNMQEKFKFWSDASIGIYQKIEQ